jgi:hypothetical protein
MKFARLNYLRRKLMQVILNIPDEIPQEMISKMLIQKEKPVPKFGSAKGLIKMSADFDEPLDDFADYM